MAANGQVDVSSIIGGGGATPESQDELSKILVQTGVALQNYRAGQAGIAKASADLQQQQQVALATKQQQATDAADAAARLAAAKGQNAQAEVTANVNAQQATGLTLDPGSILTQSIRTINDAHDKMLADINEAQRKTNTSISDVLDSKKNYTLGQYINDKILNPATTDLEQAQIEKAKADAESGRIAELQKIFTGQAQVNAATANKVTDAMIADSALVAASEWKLKASDARIQAIGSNQDYFIKLGQLNLQQFEAANTNLRTQVEVINAKRTWMMQSWRTGNTTPEDDLATIKIGAAALGYPGSTALNMDNYRQMQKSPEGKFLLDQFRQSGSIAASHTYLESDMPMPAVAGSAGNYLELADKLGLQPIGGSEPVVGKLRSIAATVSPGTKPADRVKSVNDSVYDYAKQHADDMFDDPVYGGVSVRNIMTMQGNKPAATLLDPAVKPFTDKVLTPLSTQDKPVTADMIVTAALDPANGLSRPQVIAGLKAVGLTMKGFNASVQQPTRYGFPQLPGYTATVSDGSMLFGTKLKVDLTDEKSITDMLAKRDFQTGRTDRHLRVFN